MVISGYFSVYSITMWYPSMVVKSVSVDDLCPAAQVRPQNAQHWFSCRKAMHDLHCTLEEGAPLSAWQAEEVLTLLLQACQALSGTLSSILWPKYLQHPVKFHIALDF